MEIAREEARGNLENFMKDLEIKTGLKTLSFLYECYSVQHLGNLGHLTNTDSMDKSFQTLAAIYAGYTTLINNREEIIAYIDASLQLDPKVKLPKEHKFGQKIGVIDFTKGTIGTNKVNVKSYKVPDEDFQRCLVILESRRSRIKIK